MISGNIYRWELKRYRTSTIAWCVSIGGLIVLGMAFFPLMVQESVMQHITAFLETGFMKNLMTAFGADVASLTNVLGFYCTRSAMFFQILGSFFSIMLASKILAQEEHEKTAEFLLSRPVTRIQILSSKLMAYFTYLVILNVVIVLVGFTSIESFKSGTDYSFSAFVTHHVYTFLLMLVFGAIGLFVSLLIKRGRPVTNIAIGIVMGTYFFDFLSKITPAADKLGYISPFKFIDAGVMRPDYGLDGWRVLYFAAVSLVLIAATYWVYRKKDILI